MEPQQVVAHFSLLVALCQEQIPQQFNAIPDLLKPLPFRNANAILIIKQTQVPEGIYQS